MHENSTRSEREIGRVVSVSNYRLSVLLAPEIRSQVRSHPHQITLVTQIGGYVLFPVAPGEYTVGIVIGAFENETIEPNLEMEMTLQLASARRILRLNLVGQLIEKQPFSPGVSVYPSLDTPALLPTEEQLHQLLEYHPPSEEESKDTPLNIGVSPIYARQSVTASYNDLLGRPLGIVGNTGSGKSGKYSIILTIKA